MCDNFDFNVLGELNLKNITNEIYQNIKKICLEIKKLEKK